METIGERLSEFDDSCSRLIQRPHGSLAHSSNSKGNTSRMGRPPHDVVHGHNAHRHWLNGVGGHRTKTFVTAYVQIQSLAPVKKRRLGNICPEWVEAGRSMADKGKRRGAANENQL
uniref:Uncharacterized protein n=1 Tax=Plectus sambesii TaxID=2011161 RepID=A0A914V294_9BILA